MQWACQVVKWMVQPITSGCNEKRNGLPWCLSNVFCDSEKTQIESHPQKVVEYEDDPFLLFPFGMHLLYIKMFFYDLCGADGWVFRDTYIYIHIYTYVPEWSRESQWCHKLVFLHTIPSPSIPLYSTPFKREISNSNKIKLLMFGLLFC